MSHSKLSGDDPPPLGGDNEEFIVAYHKQEASRAGKIRNMTRKWNNIQSGRANVQFAKQLSLFDIALIHNASRISSRRVQLLTIESLKKHERSAIQRRCEAFKLLKSWVNGEKHLSVNGAQLLLQSDNLKSTQHLGLDKIAEKVIADFEREKEAADALFTTPSANEKQHSSDGADLFIDDDPMLPRLAEERSPTPPPAAVPENLRDERTYGIHHSMMDFHIPFSQVSDTSAFNGIYEEKTQTTQQSMLLATVLVEDVLQHNIGLWKMTDEQLLLLVDADVIPKISFNRVLAHVQAYKRIDQSTMDYFLSVLHLYKPEINYATLPRSSKTLLRILPEDKTDGVSITDIKGKPIDPGPDEPPGGVYMHLGVARAILGESIGVVNTFEYVNTLRTLFFLWPELFTEEMRRIIRPRRGEEYDKELLKKWNVPKPEPGLHQNIVVEMHGHIDGVQLFKNSATGKGIPILGRVTAIRDADTGLRVTLPPLEPFVIGIMHETGEKPDICAFSSKFVDELKQLSSRKTSGHSFTVEMTAMICDAVERFQLKGTQSATGYDCCERCRMKGEYVDGAVRYTCLFKDLKRKDSSWGDYLVNDPRRSDPTTLEGKTTRPHRNKPASIFDGKLPFRNIMGFPLESMHLVDGGVLKDLMLLIRKISCKSGIGTVNAIERHIKFLDAYRSLDQARQLRSMKILERWKMREIHVFFMYFAYHIYNKVATNLAKSEELLDACRHLLVALHLVKGFSSKRIDPDIVKRAQSHIDKFLEIFEREFSLSHMTYKMHSLRHMLDDVAFHKCHLEYLSSYPYENFHGKWRGFLRSGRLPLSQIRNRLIELHKYVLPTDSSGRKSVQPLAFTSTEFEYMRKNKTLELPPNWPHRVDRKTNEARRRGQVVVNKVRHYIHNKPRQAKKPVKSINFRNLEFRGHLVSKDVYPHNILLMKNGSVVFATKFMDSLDLKKDSNDPRDICVIGHEFKRHDPIFKDPCNSLEIGFGRVSRLSLTPGVWKATDIDSKCLIYPDDSSSKLQLNPLPDSVRHASTPLAMVQEHAKIFGLASNPTWTVISLLLPGREY